MNDAGSWVPSSPGCALGVTLVPVVRGAVCSSHCQATCVVVAEHPREVSGAAVN